MSEITKPRDVWFADLGDGTYRNPILYADYSDPDIVRVGEHFYMVASSFANTPGLPVLHSQDLVNWTLIGHVVDRLPLDRYDIPQPGEGVWAPSIRFHDGMYWVYFSTPDEGIFVSKAEHPAGPWSPLHLVKAVKGWIDPCPFWDEDGRAYLVHAFAKSRCGIKSKLQICRMKPEGTELLDEGTIVFDGTEHHPTIEGPKFYKRNGYYYIFAPAGGVATGWQTVLRSKSVFGPYEDKIVMHQGDTMVNGPHQGGYVKLESGESWFVHFQDCDAYGRIVHLQPMSWTNDWPLIGIDTNGDGIGQPVAAYTKPNVGAVHAFAVPATSDEFDDAERLGLQWQWQANYKRDWFALGLKASHLRLFAQPFPAGSGRTLREAPNVLTQKLPSPAFTATAKLTLYGGSKGVMAGLVVIGHCYRYLAVELADGSLKLRLVEKSAKLAPMEVLVEEVRTAAREVQAAAQPERAAAITGGAASSAYEAAVYLRVSVVEGALCTYSWSRDNKRFVTIGKEFAASEGHWVGAQVGMFCMQLEGDTPAGYTDVDWFRVE
jgi:beta-xylosidase